jgi:hypothetical protein
MVFGLKGQLNSAQCIALGYNVAEITVRPVRAGEPTANQKLQATRKYFCSIMSSDGALPQTPPHFFSLMKRNRGKKNQAKIKLGVFSYVAFRLRATQFLRVLRQGSF